MLFGKKKRRIVKLLVVEDEPLVAFDTEHFLTDAGYTIVATVDRVADASSVIRLGTALDLVLVDVSLADGSGIDVARAAREAGVPVLFVTGNCPVEAIDFAAGCLPKPYAQRDLLGALDVLDAHLSGRRVRKMPSGLRLFAAAQATS
ncbi:response regulator [Sphingomonas sp. FARSPH]|uniref:response regulator n=1 Tax=Sphingomonas sp. FARSPH TaxID=2219696 RepID=UPI000E105ADF|nr:response regulator [Sphingomonas sp. FARSPH]AXJ97162.1 response regulator [Sphingomonas sp. FARSPH]